MTTPTTTNAARDAGQIGELKHSLYSLIDAASGVGSNWESGDLAGAVRLLMIYRDNSIALLKRLSGDPEYVAARLEYLRCEIRAERISYGEIAELQDLAAFIGSDDVELLQWAGVAE